MLEERWANLVPPMGLKLAAANKAICNLKLPILKLPPAYDQRRMALAHSRFNELISCDRAGYVSGGGDSRSA